MTKDTTVNPVLDFQLIAKIGLSVGIVSFLGLLVVLLVIADGNASGYGEIIGAVGMVKEALTPAMLVFGLTMVAFAGVTTWLFALYASFRIAGPLYRLARDLELQINTGTVKPIPIRTTDKLQAEWHGFEGSVTSLRNQKDRLKQVLTQVEGIIELDPSVANTEELKAAVANLCEAANSVKI
jgi:hypothetical protein